MIDTRDIRQHKRLEKRVFELEVLIAGVIDTMSNIVERVEALENADTTPPVVDVKVPE